MVQPASLSNNASQVINKPKDDWLGLRPPLRTFQRLKWEHIKEHKRADYGSGTWTGEVGSVKDRIMNPYVHDGGIAGYGIKGSSCCYVKEVPDPTPEDPNRKKKIPKGCAKCNIYTGEMLFRSGFRTIIWAGGLCPKEKISHRLKYLSPRLIRINTNSTVNLNTSQNNAKINFSENECSVDWSKATHYVYTLIGRKTAPDKATINQGIKEGNVFIIATDSHVPTIHDVINCTSNQIKVQGMHQWTSNNSDHTVPWTKSTNDTTIIRINPGGDPTEEWGQLESNCLEKVP